MDRNDTDRLFLLLAQFWPNKKVDSDMKLAWSLALEPYGYADVKAAAIDYARRNKYFPDLADLTGGLPRGDMSRDDSALLKKLLDRGSQINNKTRRI